MSFEIRSASLNDIKTMLGWAGDEQWGLGLHDALPYHVGDPKGFFMAYLDNEPIGCIAGIRYSDTFGFIGLYMVKPAFRGKGYGLQLWNKAMEYLKGCNIGLDGLEVQQKNYEKSGFKLSYYHHHFFSEKTTRSLPVFQQLSSVCSAKIQDATTVPFEKIVNYCNAKFPVSRTAFLATWLSMPSTYSLVAMEGDQIKGFGVIRPCQGNYTIAPLFADSKDIARALYISLAQKAKDEVIYMDVPDLNKNAFQLANELQLKESFKTARMYTGESVSLQIDTVYSATSMTMG